MAAAQAAATAGQTVGDGVRRSTDQEGSARAHRGSDDHVCRLAGRAAGHGRLRRSDPGGRAQQHPASPHLGRAGTLDVMSATPATDAEGAPQGARGPRPPRAVGRSPPMSEDSISPASPQAPGSDQDPLSRIVDHGPDRGRPRDCRGSRFGGGGARLDVAAPDGEPAVPAELTDSRTRPSPDVPTPQPGGPAPAPEVPDFRRSRTCRRRRRSRIRRNARRHRIRPPCRIPPTSPT